MLDASGGEVVEVLAVSYTHLDVYKRQEQGDPDNEQVSLKDAKLCVE